MPPAPRPATGLGLGLRPALRVALLGFTAFEREHLAAALRGAGSHAAGVLITAELAGSNLAIVNADDDDAVAAVRRLRRGDCTVALGHTPQPDMARQLARAAPMTALMRALDELAGQNPPMSESVQRVRDELCRFARLLAVHRPDPAPSGPTRARRRAALVAVSTPALQEQLVGLLHEAGLAATVLPDATSALQHHRERPADWVLLGTGDQQHDPFHVCRHLKTGPAPVPRVALVLQDDAPVTRLRAAQAGADACLAPPLNAERVRALVRPESETDGPSTVSAIGLA